jgi:hypothetical protein
MVLINLFSYSNKEIPVFCYKLYDKNDSLLFIGVTINMLNRLVQHAREDSWYKEVVCRNIEIQGYMNRVDGYNSRREELEASSPRYSKIYKDKKDLG